MADRIDGVDEEQPGGRVRRLLEMFRKSQAQQEQSSPQTPQNPFQKAASALQRAAHLEASAWSADHVASITKLVLKALAQAAKDARALDVRNQFAIDQAVEQTRSNLSTLMENVNPPSEIAESEDFLELMEMLKPPAQQREQSSFHKETGLKGGVKSDIQMQQVAQAVKDAAKLAAQKIEVRTQNNPNLSQFAQMSLEQMARFIQRFRKKKKKGAVVDENGEVIAGEEVDEAEEVEYTQQLQAMMELFSAKALETMRSIRSEIAPKWAPEQQPWLIAQADRMVYDILLATVPEDLMAETQTWQQIQDLREGQAVFTLRAASKLTDAASRKR